MIEHGFLENHAEIYSKLEKVVGKEYISDDPTIYARQKFKRVRASDIKRISDAIAIKILVGYIKHPELSAEELSSILRREQDLDISPSMITDVLSFHGLLKKIPDSRR